MKLVDREQKILGIDIENHPLWYGGGDFVYDLVFCITTKWLGTKDKDTLTVLLDWSQDDETLIQLLTPIRAQIEEADALLGHNFQHDWKGLVTTYNHLAQPFLVKRPVVDTMRCIPSGIPRSLEFLCAKFELGEKPHLTAHDWTEAIFRRNPEKLAMVRNRNRMDVILTERLYHKERELGWI